MSFSISEAEVPLPGAVLQAAPSKATLDFSRTYDEYFDFVWRNLRRLGVQESGIDDALQDAFIVVHRRWQDYEPAHGSFHSWLFGIVIRVAKDHRRTHARKDPAAHRAQSQIDPDTIAADGKSPQERAELAQQMSVLHTLLSELDEAKRSLLVLAELEQMTAPEISNALAIPVNTVYSRLRVARQAFDVILTRYRESGTDQ